MNFWDLINKYEIKIPSIQRDYAQGRNTEKEIAINFIETLYESLINKRPLNLDFIYGKVDEGDRLFIPIDGQQRLTTLWLLHWYIATKEEKLATVKDQLIKLSYETRLTSQDFCKNLIKRSIDNYIKDSNISTQIQNQNWYRLTWEQDPTVKNMLNMLDIIHDKFKNTQNLFDQLFSDDCPISFHLLEMKEFYLTDELYIKMNARGKTINKFEYFKAKFSQMLDEDKYKLDTIWLNNIFWKKYSKKVIKGEILEDRIEDYFYNFFENLTLLLYAEEKSSNDDSKNFIDKAFINNYDLLIFFDNEIKKDENIRIVFKNRNIERIKKILDYIEKLPDINSFFLEREKNENDNFDNFVKSHKDISYPERVKFYSIILYIDYVCSNSIDNDTKLKQRWLRITKNLINNTRIDEPDEFQRAVGSLKKLSAAIENLYDLLAEERVDIEFFYKDQVQEEKEKCRLILKDKEWENLIIEAEKFYYFDGQIKFLLDMSQTSNSNGNSFNKQKFEIYFKKLKIIFEKLKNNTEFLFERALLSKGNYLVEKGSNHTFCNYNEGLRDKMENWRKVFNEEYRRNLLKTLLDDIYDIDNIEDNLKTIINDYLNNHSWGNIDWRYFFIKDPKLLSYCTKRQIRFENPENSHLPLIYLLSKERLNGEHAELYTYNLCLYLEKIFQEVRYIFSNSYDLPKILVKTGHEKKEIIYDKNKQKFVFLDEEFEVFDLERLKNEIEIYISYNQ